MRYALLVLLLIVSVAPAWAQTLPMRTGSSVRAVISVTPSYQQWNDDTAFDDTFREVSIPLQVQVVANRNLSFTLAASQASADGDGMTAVSGITDTRVGATYRYEFGEAHLMASLGLNLPSGKKEWAPDEFTTAFFLSQDAFRFQVPSFGQGFNWSPGLAVAVPVSEQLVVGVGATYQGRGSYRPLEAFGDFIPGDEFLLTGGFDYRLATTTFLSGDVTYTLYQADQLDGLDVFAAGNKLVLSAQVRHLFGLHEAWVFGRYRTRSASEVLAAGQLQLEADKTLPDNAEFMGHLSLHVHRTLRVRFTAEGRFFQASAQREALSIIGVGLSPELLLTRQVRLPLRAKVFVGDVAGFEVGLGLVVTV